METYGKSIGRKYWEELEEAGQKSLNPHKKDDTTTIEITEEIRDYLKQFRGRNYTERIGSLDYKQNCCHSGTSGCSKKATNALRVNLGGDLDVAIPLCEKHLEQADVDNMATLTEMEK